MLVKLALGRTPEGGSGVLFVRSSAIVALGPDAGSTPQNRRLRVYLTSGEYFSIVDTKENEQAVKTAIADNEPQYR